MTEQDVFPRKGQSGSGTEIGYSVEARYNYPSPKAFGDIILDDRWRTVHFPEGKTGVPAGPIYYTHTRAQGLFGYSAAQALRWWLHALADAEILGGLCIETRLVKHEINYSNQTTIIAAQAYIGGDDRSNTMPPKE
jgi:hypothetical protein